MKHSEVLANFSRIICCYVADVQRNAGKLVIDLLRAAWFYLQPIVLKCFRQCLLTYGATYNFVLKYPSS